MCLSKFQISRRTSEDNELNGSLGRSKEAALLVSHIQPEVPAADHVPASEELLIHILFDLLSHVLLVGPVLHRVANHVLGLELDIVLHLGVEDLDAPLLCALVHSNYYKLHDSRRIVV